MPERTTVTLADDFLLRARREAATEGRNLTALIEEDLRLVVDERARPSAIRRVSLPVSSATGGVMPGIDIDNSAALQEIDDLEYVRRLARFGVKLTFKSP